VMFERFHDDRGEAVKLGDILFASLTLSGTEYRLYRHTMKDGTVDYFNQNGDSVKKALLRTPIDGAKLTSGFGARRHPILGYTRMHQGVDFGAPTGTPIMAAGDGVVERAGINSGYGNYIAIRPGESGGPPQREFEARPKAPPLDLGAPGLHLVLFSDNLGSMEVGSPILYRQVKVGSVQSFQLSRDDRQVVLGVHIEPEYSHLVNTSTRFWNASGITLKGGLSGVEVKSESLQTLLAGGIAFETPEPQAARSDRRVQPGSATGSCRRRPSSPCTRRRPCVRPSRARRSRSRSSAPA